MKQKILVTFVESGFGHISSMESVYDALCDKYSDKYEIEKSYILREDNLPHLSRMEDFIIRQVERTNRVKLFGKFVFPFIGMLGGQHVVRFFHRQMAVKSFHEGLEAIKRRRPQVIVTNHYFTDLLAVEYKHRIDPSVVVINYNPDCTLHTFWDKRDGIFIVNNQKALDRALRYGFKPDYLRLVSPCVRKSVEQNTLGRAELREKLGLPQDKFTVVIADGGYMLGRGPKFAKKLIKSRLPITLCVLAGKNGKRYEEFKAIAEGRAKLKLDPGMTLKVYEFMPNAYELYGAADLFLTKGGPNAVLDSLYMHTPVMVDYCPHVIEEWTVKTYVNDLGCGETAFRPGKAVKRIKLFMADRSELDRYAVNIERVIEKGNGATAVADIIDEEAERRSGADGDAAAVCAEEADSAADTPTEQQAPNDSPASGDDGTAVPDVLVGAMKEHGTEFARTE